MTVLDTVSIDTDALWHTVAISFSLGLVAILAAGSVIFSVDRSERGGTARIAWYGVALIGALITIGVVVLGIWAMTQKS